MNQLIMHPYTQAGIVWNLLVCVQHRNAVKLDQSGLTHSNQASRRTLCAFGMLHSFLKEFRSFEIQNALMNSVEFTGAEHPN